MRAGLTMPQPRWRRFIRLALSGTTVGGLLASTMLIAGSAAADTRPAVDHDTVLSGVITSHGSPVAGAAIYLIAWPNDEVLEQLEVEQDVTSVVVATGTSDHAGRFAISLAPATVGPQHTEADGDVHLEVVIADERQELTWFFTATRSDNNVNGGATWTNRFIEQSAVATRLDEGKAPTHIDVDFGTSAASVVEEGNEPATWIGPDDEELGVEAGALASLVPVTEPQLEILFGDEPRPLDMPTCPLAWKKTDNVQRNRMERYVRSVGTAQVRPTVTQETGTSHKLGVALKIGTGDWYSGSSSHTLKTGAEAVWPYPGPGLSHYLYNRVNYRQYRKVCNTHTRYQWRRDSWYALATDRVSVSRPNSWTSAGCQRHRSTAGTRSKFEGKNATYSQGVDLNVVNVTSQASYDAGVKITWRFVKDSVHDGGRLCSSNSEGWASSKAPQAGGFIP
jgi:hypothetical protein